MSFGTEGHRAAGTSENDMPRMIMAAYASSMLGNPGSTSAKIRWHAIIRIAPQMSIVAPLPRLSRKRPRNGVMAAAPIGNQRNMPAAVSADTCRLFSSMLVA